jgi:hypothetical protein
VDFLLHLGDGAPPGLPLVQVNINRSNAQAGFTIPKYMWQDALGPQQFQLLAECLQVRLVQGSGWYSCSKCLAQQLKLLCGWISQTQCIHIGCDCVQLACMLPLCQPAHWCKQVSVATLASCTALTQTLLHSCPAGQVPTAAPAARAACCVAWQQHRQCARAHG